MSVVVVALLIVVAIVMIILMVVIVVVMTIFVLLLPGARLELPREAFGPLHQVAEGPALRALHNLLDVLLAVVRVGVGLCRRITESGVVRLCTIISKVEVRVMFQMFVVLDARRQGYDDRLAVLHDRFCGVYHLRMSLGFVHM